MIKIIFSVIVPVLLLLLSNTVLISTQTIVAAATTKIYENSQYGFKIEYPADWSIPSKNSSMDFPYYGTNTVIAFVSPVGTFLDIDKHTFLAINVTPVEKSVDKKDLKVKPKTLDDIVADKIKFLSKSKDVSVGNSDILHEILKSNSTAIGENPAKQIQYVTHFSGLADTFNIDTYIIKDDKLYTLVFTTGPLVLPETLPTAQKTIHSFQFIS